jgi:hypothetical protein
MSCSSSTNGSSGPNTSSGNSAIQVLNVLPKKGSSRPIRKMRVACAVCQSNKQKCDAQRPCSRCVAKGKPHLCYDRNQDSISAEAADIALPDTMPELPPKRAYKKRKAATEAVHEETVPETLHGIYHLMSESIMEALVESIPESVKNIHEEKSPLFIRDWVLHHTNSWKMYLATMKKFLGEKKLEDIKRSIRTSIELVVCMEEDKYFGAALLQWIDELELFNISSYAAETVNTFPFTLEELNHIISVFNVQNVFQSDLAIIRCSSCFQMNSNDVSFVMQANPNFERMIGLSFSQLANLAMEKKQSSDHDLPPFVWFMTKDSWHDYTKFMVLSYFQKMTVSKVKLTMAHRDGRQFPCFVLLIASYDANLQVRNAVTMVMKPLSVTFDPVLDE